MDQNPNTTEHPFGGDAEGDHNQVRAGLYAALMEALIRFLATVEGVTADAKATRRAAHYLRKDAFKMSRLVEMVRFVGINAKTVTQDMLLSTGLMSFRGLIVNGRPFTLNTMDRLVMVALEQSSAFRRAAAGWMAFHQWEATDLRTRMEMVRKSGQEALEVPEGMTALDETSAAAFGWKAGDFVRHVVVSSHLVIREAFVALRAKLDGLPIVGVSNIKTLNETGTQEHLNASEDMHLTLNLHTLMDWFVSRVFPTQRYCGECKAAGRKAVFGNQQVAAGQCCPQCANPVRFLGRNGNTGHLPLISSAKAGLKVYGGWRVAMTSFRMPKRSFTALLRASQGRMPVEDALHMLMTLPVDARVQNDGKTVWMKHRLVPVVYEVVHSTGGEHQLLHGLALEPIHLGDL